MAHLPSKPDFMVQMLKFKWTTKLLVQMWYLLGHCEVCEWFQVSMQVSHQSLLANQIYYTFYVYITSTARIFNYVEGYVWSFLSLKMLCRFSCGFTLMSGSVFMELFDIPSFLLVYVNNYIWDQNTLDHCAVP